VADEVELVGVEPVFEVQRQRVRIVDGLGESLPDVVDSLGASTGLLKSRTDGLQTSIDDLNAKVLREQDRVTRFEERLRRTYSNLEVTMGRLNALGDYVSQQLGSMSSSRKK
jgi:flagellar hook-associated protein 2